MPAMLLLVMLLMLLMMVSFLVDDGNARSPNARRTTSSYARHRPGAARF
jgi:hypothetical protein